MFIEITKNINWVDVFLVAVIARVIFIGIKNGFISESFKLLGIIFGIFIAFHYYAKLAQIFKGQQALPFPTIEFLFFSLLCFLVLLIFKLIRDASTIMFKIEAHPLLDKWGGGVMAVLRSALVCSLILVSLLISDIGYLKGNVKSSFFSSFLFDLSPEVYKACYNGFVSKFFPSEKLNLAVLELRNGESPDSP